MTNQGPTLEQFVPGELHPMEGTHNGAVGEELQLVGGTFIGEDGRELFLMGGTPG